MAVVPAENSARYRAPIWLWIALAVSVLLSFYSIAKRHQVEARNKSVSIAAEFEVVEGLAASQGLTIEEAIEKLKAQGLNALVLSEETVGDLASTGRLRLQSSAWPGGPEAQRQPLSSLVFSDTNQIPRVQKGLQVRFKALAGRLSIRNEQLMLPPVSASLVRSTAVGLNPDQARVAQTAGVQIIGRFANPSGISSGGVRETLQWGKDLGASIFLPMGDQVIGRRESIDTTIDSLKALNLLYATPEFTKIGGDANIVAAIPDHVIRLHSAQSAELDKLPLVDAVERYGRAARERNMRILLLRPISFAADQPLNEFGSFVKAVNDQVRLEGGEIGIPRPFEAPDLPGWWAVLIAVAASPIAWFAFSAYTNHKKVRWAMAAILGLLAVASVAKTGSQATAFVFSLGFPVAGYVLLDQYKPRNILIGYLLVSALSFAGGICIAGMLNGLQYYVQAAEFRGVKMSVFLPIVLVGALFFLRLVDWQGTMKSPITWGTAGTGFVILIALALMVARTGNDTGAGASDMELVFRNVLDRYLYVRPRTKEFLIGHPLLFVGIGMLISYYSLRARMADNPALEPRVRALGGWTTIVLMVSAAGQTSIVNTMTHMHIPVLLSIARIAEGLVIGCIIGWALWTILSRAALRVEK